MWRTRIFFSVLLAFFLFGYSSASDASSNYPASTLWQDSTWPGLGKFSSSGSLASAVNSYITSVCSQYGTNGAPVTVTVLSPTQVSFTPTGASCAPQTFGVASIACPYGGTLSGSTCIGGNPPASCSAGTEFISCGSTSGASVCGSSDANGCPVTPAPGVCFGQAGIWMCPVYTSGNTSANSPPAGVTQAPGVPGPCPSGQSSGTVNGVPVCVGSGGTSTPAPVTPASTPSNPCSGGLTAGSINGQTVCTTAPQTAPGVTNVTTVVNGGTTTITTSQTSCNGSSCTTVSGPAKSASAPPGSASGPVTSNTQSKSQFCASNPTSPLCASTGTVTGSCSTGFSGSDNSPDTVAAVALANLDCSAPAAGASVPLSGPPASVGSNPAQSSVDAGPPAPSSGGACPIAVQSFSVGQMSATVDLTPLCSYFATFRAVLIAFASVMWFLVIGRWRG